MVIGAGGVLDTMEQLGQQQCSQGLGQQQVQYREVILDHVGYGVDVFLYVLEYQVVQVLVEFVIEIQFDYGEEQVQVGSVGQLGNVQMSRVHCCDVEQ